MWGDRRGGMAVVLLIAATVVIFISVARQALQATAVRQRPNAFGEYQHQAECRAHGLQRGPAKNASLHLLSWEPRVILVKNFATKEEVEVYVDTASPLMKDSKVKLPEGKAREKVQSIGAGARTSRGAFIGPKNDPTGTIGRLERRLAALCGIPPDTGEVWNVLHYPLNAHYAHHHDYFPPELNPSTKDNNRMATFLLYLRSPDEGGQTIFPRCSAGDNHIRPYEEVYVRPSTLSLKVGRARNAARDAIN